MQLRQILKSLGKSYTGKAKIRELLNKKKYRLKDEEYELLAYAYIDKLSVENICMKLNFSAATYHNFLKISLRTLEALITDAEFRELINYV